MKIHRLLEITTILLNKGTVTAGELAEHFEVSTRTVYRDIEALSQAGVPVYMRAGNGGGISLLENYTLNKALISDAEQENLMLALKTVQATNFPEIESLLSKLGSVFKNTDEADWVRIEFSHWGSRPDEDQKFTRIKNAILRRTVIAFDYVNMEGQGSRRSVEPMSVWFKGQTWYLWGYCRLRREFRVFRLSRIKNLDITCETFERRPVPEEENDSFNIMKKPMVAVKLRFSASILYRVFDDFDESQIQRNADGSVDVSVVWPEDDWFYSYFLSFGNGIEVLEPLYIRENFIRKLKEILNIYKA